MIAPVILLTGVGVQAVSKMPRIRHWKAVAVAILCVMLNQLTDFSNGRIFDGGDGHIQHYILAGVGCAFMLWFFRRYWWGMMWAVIPDVIDFLPSELAKFHIIPNGEWIAEWGRPVHHIFWNQLWSEPRYGSIWLVVFIVLATAIMWHLRNR